MVFWPGHTIYLILSDTRPAIAQVMFFNSRHQAGPGGRPPKKQDDKISAKISRRKFVN
jgi:hypothetical protein